MKIAPVSADLLIKVGIGLAACGLVYIAYRKISGAASSAIDSVGEAASAAVDAVNPASPTNIVNRGFNAVTQAIAGDPNWTLGGAIYDWTHPDPLKSPAKVASPKRPQSPMRYQATPVKPKTVPLTLPQGHTAYWKS